MSGTTNQKLKIIGEETYINAETGELHTMKVVEMSMRDAHFQKLWVGKILEAVKALSTNRLQVVMWLIQESARHRNIIPMTVHEMARKLKMSPVTVTKTLQLLEEHDVIRRKTGSVWVNPDVVFKGGASGRLEVLTRYREIPREEEEPETAEAEANRLANEKRMLERRMREIQERERSLGIIDMEEESAAAE